MNDAGWDSASKRLSGRRRFGVVCLQLKALVFLPRGLAEGVRKVHSEGLKLFNSVALPQNTCFPLLYFDTHLTDPFIH